MSTTGPERVLAVLDDASMAETLLEASCALAQLVQRELQLVFVESAAALAAAELPSTRVLAQAARTWTPLAPEDVERGWRVQAARLRALAEQATTRRTVSWSMRITRGALRQTALALRDETDLLLVAAAPSHFALADTRSERTFIAALDDGSAAGQAAVRLRRPPRPGAGRAAAPVQDRRATPAAAAGHGTARGGAGLAHGGPGGGGTACAAAARRHARLIRICVRRSKNGLVRSIRSRPDAVFVGLLCARRAWSQVDGGTCVLRPSLAGDHRGPRAGCSSTPPVPCPCAGRPRMGPAPAGTTAALPARVVACRPEVLGAAGAGGSGVRAQAPFAVAQAVAG